MYAVLRPMTKMHEVAQYDHKNQRQQNGCAPIGDVASVGTSIQCFAVILNSESRRGDLSLGRLIHMNRT